MTFMHASGPRERGRGGVGVFTRFYHRARPKEQALAEDGDDSLPLNQTQQDPLPLLKLLLPHHLQDDDSNTNNSSTDPESVAEEQEARTVSSRVPLLSSHVGGASDTMMMMDASFLLSAGNDDDDDNPDKYLADHLMMETNKKGPSRRHYDDDDEKFCEKPTMDKKVVVPRQPQEGKSVLPAQTVQQRDPGPPSDKQASFESVSSTVDEESLYLTASEEQTRSITAVNNKNPTAATSGRSTHAAPPSMIDENGTTTSWEDEIVRDFAAAYFASEFKDKEVDYQTMASSSQVDESSSQADETLSHASTLKYFETHIQQEMEAEVAAEQVAERKRQQREVIVRNRVESAWNEYQDKKQVSERRQDQPASPHSHEDLIHNMSQGANRRPATPESRTCPSPNALGERARPSEDCDRITTPQRTNKARSHSTKPEGSHTENHMSNAVEPVGQERDQHLGPNHNDFVKIEPHHTNHLITTPVAKPHSSPTASGGKAHNMRMSNNDTPQRVNSKSNISSHPKKQNRSTSNDRMTSPSTAKGSMPASVYQKQISPLLGMEAKRWDHSSEEDETNPSSINKEVKVRLFAPAIYPKPVRRQDQDDLSTGTRNQDINYDLSSSSASASATSQTVSTTSTPLLGLELCSLISENTDGDIQTVDASESSATRTESHKRADDQIGKQPDADKGGSLVEIPPSESTGEKRSLSTLLNRWRRRPPSPCEV